MLLTHLTRAPFNLDAAGVEWVRQTYDGLTLRDKVAQLFVLISMGDDPAALAQLKTFRPGGFTRFFGPDIAHEHALLTAMQASAEIPLLISADLEGSRMSIAGGTPVLNPLALAAIDDLEVTRDTCRIMAEEALALGVNWSFTPVLDINAAWRSAIVATRGFGRDVETIKRHALAQIAVFQAHGLAATAKHWPGEGFDDRDQHLVTTVNPLSMEDWEANFGNLYRAAIDAGVLSVMSAHIALPAFVRASNPDAGLEAFRPASVSHALNIDLLRGRLGFNGVIVSDASIMGGLNAWSGLTQAKVDIIANGCDIILFSFNPEAELQAVLDAVATGEISAARLQDAVTRVLGLKAALGLHQGRGLPQPDGLARMGTAGNRDKAAAMFRRAPTLVKDTQNLLPLNPVTHRRVLVISGGIVSPIHPPAGFILPDLLRKRGFEVSVFEKGTRLNPVDFDLILYLFGEETLLTRSRIFIDWADLMGGFEGAMARFWHDVPTAMISFGYPYYLYDAPRVPTYINAYCTLDQMQEAVVELMLGNAPWTGANPVDPFCGLEDAQY